MAVRPGWTIFPTLCLLFPFFWLYHIYWLWHIQGKDRESSNSNPTASCFSFSKAKQSFSLYSVSILTPGALLFLPTACKLKLGPQQFDCPLVSNKRNFFITLLKNSLLFCPSPRPFPQLVTDLSECILQTGPGLLYSSSRGWRTLLESGWHLSGQIETGDYGR